MQGIGADMTLEGSTPEVSKSTILARVGHPLSSAASFEQINRAAAPSLTWLEFPAVTIPSCMKTGLSLERASNEELSLTPSSLDNPPTGVISLLVHPLNHDSEALACDFSE